MLLTAATTGPHTTGWQHAGSVNLRRTFVKVADVHPARSCDAKLNSEAFQLVLLMRVELPRYLQPPPEARNPQPERPKKNLSADSQPQNALTPLHHKTEKKVSSAASTADQEIFSSTDNQPQNGRQPLHHRQDRFCSHDKPAAKRPHALLH